MRFQVIKKIMKKNEKYTNMLAEYDKTGLFPLDKIRRSFTLQRRTINKLKELSKDRKKNMSELIDSMINNT